ncbi:MAG: DUF4080 domain-containing protein [Treponema sp.]|nr:DUF4080 domain-containing protein [Treponema sp.]
MKKIICTTLLVETSPQAMPLGAACIASAIKSSPQTTGHFAVELRDFSLEDAALCRLTDDAEKAAYIARALLGVSADVERKTVQQDCAPVAVCFSVYVWNHVLLETVAHEVKKLLPDVVCIAGGPEVTANPAVFTQFDYTIAGQGEGAVPALLAELFLQDNAKNYKPIAGVYAVSTKQGAGRALPCLPNELSSPYLDGTLDVSKYGGALWELARGCPFKCSYCYESKGEQKIAYFPMERLEKEIELFAAKKILQVFVLDPTYNANKQRAVQMLRTIAKKAPGMFFYFEARAEFIDRELARAFATIPCALQIGLQSADPAVLKNVHRTLDKKIFVRNIGYLNEAGVTFGFDLIYGLPGDTYAGFCKSIDFALSLYPNNLELFCLSVLPGTTLHDDAAGFGMEWEQMPPYHVLKTPQFSERDLSKAEKLARAVNLFYNDGRAVPWFNTMLFPLHKKPSAFFEEFAQEIVKSAVPAANDNDTMQLEFVRAQYKARHLDKLLPACEDFILMNNAVSRCTATGKETHLTLRFHPDDIMSEYATDLPFFVQHCGRQKCRVRVFSGKNGTDWRTE